MATAAVLPPICIACTRIFEDQPALDEHNELKPSTQKQCKTCNSVACDDLALTRHLELSEFCKNKIEAPRAISLPLVKPFKKEPTVILPAQPLKKDLRTVTRITEPVAIDQAIQKVRQRALELRISKYADKGSNTVLTYKAPRESSDGNRAMVGTQAQPDLIEW